MSEADIPVHIWKKSKVEEKLDDDSTKAQMCHRKDMIWRRLQEKLPNLSKVALAVLTIPHRNAGEERVFSMIRKIKQIFVLTWIFEDRLAQLTIKMNKPENLLPCHKFKPSQEPVNKMQSGM